MATLLFNTPPHGIDIESPDVRFLELLVLYVNEEYWSAGPGQAALTYEDNEKRTMLVLTFHLNQFYLEYHTESEPTSISFRGDTDGCEIITPFVGGNAWPLYSSFFVDRNQTWAVIDEFCRSGNKTNKIDWKWMKDTEYP